MENIFKEISGTILVTNKCNFNCSYCYVDKNETKIINKDDIETFIKGMEYHKMKKHLCFFGGEPMLAKNLILDIIESHKDFTFTIITNGTIPFENYDNIKPNLTHIIVSIEIDDISFNKYRSHNTSSFIDVWNNILKFKKLVENTTINISLNKYVIDNPDIFLNFIKQCNDHNIKFNIYDLKGYNDYNKYELYNFLEYVKTKDFEIYKILIRYDIDPYDDFQFCCTYSNSLHLDPEGNLISCPKEKKYFCNVQEFDKYHMFFKTVLENSRENFDFCMKCPVPYTFCSAACKPDFINKNLKEESCECQRLLYALFLKEKKLI